MSHRTPGQIRGSIKTPERDFEKNMHSHKDLEPVNDMWENECLILGDPRKCFQHSIFSIRERLCPAAIVNKVLLIEACDY